MSSQNEEISKLDLCFVCDTTGSMSGSIVAVQTHLKKIAETITASEKRDLMLACVQYKDHCDPVVVGSKDFTPSVSKLKQYIDEWSARGGGDHPEAVAEGLEAAGKLSWRKDSTKMLVLCADAPPHGVGSSGDRYPNGSPNGVDPLVMARDLVQKEVIMYTVGVNNPDRHTVSFLCTLSRMSGGRYLPLAEASSLPTILLGGAEEEVELAKFEKMMDEEEAIVTKEAQAKGEKLEEEELSKRVASNLMKKEVKVAQLHVSCHGGGGTWQKQEQFLSDQPSLNAYNVAQSKVDYSDIPTHGGMAPSSAYGGGGGMGGYGGGPPMGAYGGAPPMGGGAPPQMMQASPSACPSAYPSGAPSMGAAPQAQQVHQTTDYIQPEQVMRRMHRKK